MTQLLTQEQAAALINVGARRLRQIEAEDGMPVGKSGTKYDPAQFGKWLEARWRSKQKVGEDGEYYDYDVEKARLTKNQADEKGLQVAQLRGDLIPREVVLATWQAYSANVRAKLLSLPTKAAHAAIAATELHEIEEVLKAQVYEALGELTSDGIPDGYRGVSEGIGSVHASSESDSEPVGGQVPKTKSGGKRRTRAMEN